MMDHQETAADGVYHMILYNLSCFASVPVFIFAGQVRKVTGINYQNPITESCNGIHYFEHACDWRSLVLARTLNVLQCVI